MFINFCILSYNKMVEAADIQSNIDQVEQNISKFKIQGRKLKDIMDHDKG